MALATDGPPTCPACEKVIVPTWDYCASCGAKLERDAEPAGIKTVCPGCGHRWTYRGSKPAGETTSCGRCQRGNVVIGETDHAELASDPTGRPPADELPLDHTDTADLKRAYAAADSIKEAAEWFDPTYYHIRTLLIDAGIHEPDSYG